MHVEVRAFSAIWTLVRPRSWFGRYTARPGSQNLGYRSPVFQRWLHLCACVIMRVIVDHCEAAMFEIPQPRTGDIAWLASKLRSTNRCDKIAALRRFTTLSLVWLLRTPRLEDVYCFRRCLFVCLLACLLRRIYKCGTCRLYRGA